MMQMRIKDIQALDAMVRTANDEQSIERSQQRNGPSRAIASNCVYPRTNACGDVVMCAAHMKDRAALQSGTFK